MKLSDIMKMMKCKTYTIILPGSLDLCELDIPELDSFGEERIGILDDQGNLQGEVKMEFLKYIKKHADTFDAMTILDNIDEGVVAIDEAGRIFYTNKRYSVILGVPRAKVLGKYIQEIEADATIIEVLRTGQPIFKQNQRINSLDKYVEVRIFPIREKGKISGAYSIFKDITEINKLNREVLRVNNVAQDALRQNRAYQELKKQNVIGEDKRFLDLIEKAMVVAPTDVSVLIRGENGVGKEIFAKLIHSNSTRKDMPLVSLNCAAIPENLIESELFGYEEGAFTGASKPGKVGKFMLADGGTLFLDEIGDMPLLLQSKLLRVLQEGEIQPLGSKKSLKVNVRIIAATNQPLETLMEEKRFRPDLYYRLNAIMLQIPTLHERGNDVILLANFFLSKYNKEYRKDLLLSREVYDRFLVYPWPGNVRELINCIKSSVILCSDTKIKLEDLPPTLRDFGNDRSPGGEKEISLFGEEPETGSLKEQLRTHEIRILQQALTASGGNRQQAARLLGLSRRTLYRRLEELQLL